MHFEGYAVVVFIASTTPPHCIKLIFYTVNRQGIDYKC